jgi:hypothetical protein
LDDDGFFGFPIMIFKKMGFKGDDLFCYESWLENKGTKNYSITFKILSISKRDIKTIISK